MWKAKLEPNVISTTLQAYARAGKAWAGKAQSAPRRPHDGSQTLKRPPRRLRGAQEAGPTAPRWLRGGPTTAPSRSRGRPDGPETAQSRSRCPQDGSEPLQRPRRQARRLRIRPWRTSQESPKKSKSSNSFSKNVDFWHSRVFPFRRVHDGHTGPQDRPKMPP